MQWVLCHLKYGGLSLRQSKIEIRLILNTGNSPAFPLYSPPLFHAIMPPCRIAPIF
jgi:hypothetical protein